MGVKRLAGALGRALPGAGLVWFVAAQAEVARACPDCAIGRAARAQVWSEGWLFNLSAALFPFVVVAAASFWADRIGRPNPP